MNLIFLLELGIELMYLILVYDVGVERVSKVNKFLKAYLMWIQNSVFEGEISEKLFNRMKQRLIKIITDEDSVIIYALTTESYIERLIFGNEKGFSKNVI